VKLDFEGALWYTLSWVNEMYKFLDKVNSPKDIKKFKVKELNGLSNDIRSFLIDSISKTGGHLAPNLGVVELTIALHYVFNSPKDKIIFDVGHQCYVHKILTGRKDKFNTLRQTNGISGFPKNRESVHDTFDTGHSSTSISSALGIATANKLSGNNDYAIAVIGDGALTGGLAFEGLNNADGKNTNLIVILNDNQMSISESVGNLSAYLNNIRSNDVYTKSKIGIKTFLKYIPIIGPIIIKFIEWTKNALKQLILPSSILFEQFGFTYLGPIDGHDINDLINILKRAKHVNKPVLIHVVTQKGKGYEPAMKNPDKFHSISPFDINTGEVISKSNECYSKIFGNTLIELAQKNDKVVAITAAMPDSTGLCDFKKYFSDRFFDVGIAEAHAVTFASGLAKQGYIPVFAVYSTFLQRAYDQIIHDIALQNAHVIFAIDRAGIVGNDGETHHGVFDLSFLSHIPNLTIMAPKDANELKEMLEFAVAYNGPVVIRYPRDGYVEKLCESKEIKYNESEILKEGSDISIVALGKMVKTAYQIGNLLKERNINAEIINARFLKPLDNKTILQSARKTKKLITIEDNIITGGLASAVQGLMANEKDIQSMFFAYPDEFIKHGNTPDIEKYYGMNAESITNKIIENLL
jgi:1-deoxy-D-xylulose-5-phosphate synthase